jgi:WD40 repeat protein
MWTHQVHEKKVQTVSLNQVNPSYLCTASLDRSMKVWDVRKMTKSKKPLCMNQDLRSVNCASFSPDGHRIVSVGQGNELRLFIDAHLQSGEIDATHTVKHDNQTGRYLAVFHHTWDHKMPNTFVVGSMAQPRQVSSC